MGIMAGILLSAREPLMVIVVAAVIIFQVNFLAGSLGAILISLLFFYRALTSLMVMQESWNRYLEVSGSLDNLVNFQNHLNQQVEVVGTKSFRSFRNSIILENVSFAYDDVDVLKNIVLEIKKNETIAFVGESGSGKTTLVNVLSGLLPPDHGRLIIDGNEGREINITEYQGRIGYITQEPVIFNDTIFNNVTLWDDPSIANKERFLKSLTQAHILDFVMAQSAREETALGINGVNLSGGQRQRISIARELYKDIDILIMDEATSALDSETEQNIQSAIEALHGQYTLLIVAHRLSTIKNADRIVYMKKGTIESIDSYSKLLMSSNGFRRMVEVQSM
jgi:subfamily B ATP-binding cassette protein MsbA